MNVASSSSKSYTADGTPVPAIMSPTTRPSSGSLPGSLPPLVPQQTIPPSQGFADSSDAPKPMSSTAYHAYFAGSDNDDEDDYESDEEAPPQPSQPETETSKSDVKETNASDVEDVDKYFQVPQPSATEKDDAQDNDKPIPPKSPADKPIKSKADDTTGDVAKCEKKSLPATTDAITDETNTPNAEAEEPNYYMRVARVLLGILILLVVGYIVYWVLFNVFGIDLGVVLWEKLWGPSDAGATEASAPASNDSVPLSLEGQQQKQALTDKTAATLLNMMSAIRKNSE